MDSGSFQFIFFGLFIAVCVNLGRSQQWRTATLLLASGIYLAMVNPAVEAFVPMAGFLLLGYAALWLLKRGHTALRPWSITLVILVYLWLKKYTFLPAACLLSLPYFTLGLSYIFFRVLHLLIESDGVGHEPRVGFGSYLLYMIDFTTLVSGPIQRFEEFARQQSAAIAIPLGVRVIGLQLERIIRGFFKVNVLAMLLESVHEDAIAQLSTSDSVTVRSIAAFRLAIAYPFFLYCNFSGYIDIVIALARLMRLELPENFNRPFAACSVIEFWNRWHITLSTWLKTYVYNPLLVALMRRNSSARLEPYLGVLCFFVTFFLIGVWHGRTSEFVLFGLLTGGGMSVNKLWQMWMTKTLGRKGYKLLAGRGTYAALSRGLNGTWFAFTLIWFWSDWQQIGRMASALSPTQWMEVWLFVWLVLTVTLAVWERLRPALLSLRTEGGPLLTGRYARVVYATALGLVGYLMVVMLNQPAPAIVYKAF